MKRFILAAAVAALALPSIASAISVTDGNATWTIVTGGIGGNADIFNGGSGNANLTKSGGVLADFVSAYTFYGRGPANNRVWQIGNLSPTGGVTTTGSTIKANWTGWGAGTTDRADLEFTSTLVNGPGKTATVFMQLKVTSRSGSATTPANWNFYWLNDMDIPGTNVNFGPGDTVEATKTAAGITGKFTDTSIASNPDFVTFDAPGATRYELQTSSNLRAAGKLGTTALAGTGYDLPTNGLGTTSANTLTDASSAIQWTLSLRNGDSATITSAFAINSIAAVPEPTALGLLAPVGMILARRRR